MNSYSSAWWLNKSMYIVFVKKKCNARFYVVESFLPWFLPTFAAQALWLSSVLLQARSSYLAGHEVKNPKRGLRFSWIRVEKCFKGRWVNKCLYATVFSLILPNCVLSIALNILSPLVVIPTAHTHSLLPQPSTSSRACWRPIPTSEWISSKWCSIHGSSAIGKFLRHLSAHHASSRRKRATGRKLR